MSQNPENFFQRMYSKAGKSSAQIFAHLLGKTITSYSASKSQDSQSITNTPNKRSKKPLKQQPFSQGLSREYLHKLQNQGKPNLPIGIYNPKYTAVQKQKLKLLRKSDLGGKFAVEHKITIKQGSDSQASSELRNLKSKRTKGQSDLRRQVTRQYDGQQNCLSNTIMNEFLSINTNSIRGSQSAHLKGSGYSFNYNKNNFFKTLCDTDCEAGKRKRNCFWATFDKQTVRDCFMNKSVCLRDQSIYQYDQFSNTNSIVSPITTKIFNDINKVFGRTLSLKRKAVTITTHNYKILDLIHDDG
ncbi:unnamed protein product [Paramecium octaurelia]|uniref:Uncharacterized protein n=1 Tax=Paramecium octaurelia TaxID=43137 RepID=A0A8S1XGX3_PAROT|nr:unnamed protein product [Paramecium octaurelia]